MNPADQSGRRKGKGSGPLPGHGLGTRRRERAQESEAVLGSRLSVGDKKFNGLFWSWPGASEGCSTLPSDP